MALKTVLDTLEGVDDALKSFYVESEKGFVLDLEGVDNHPEVGNLVNAYGRVKADKESLKGQLSTLQEQIRELQEKAPDTAATQAKIADLQEKLTAERARGDDLYGKLSGVTLGRGIDEALSAIGVSNPVQRKAATALLKAEHKLEVGEDGSVIIDDGMGPKLFSEWSKKWAAGDGSVFLTPPTGAGAKGGKGNGGTKTFSEMNGAELVALKRTDPAAYERLKKG